MQWTSRRLPALFTLLILCLWLTPAVSADGGVQFEDIALDPASGLTYSKAPSATKAVVEGLRDRVVNVNETPFLPLFADGTPGVAILDHDGDGDLDIYVTNGPGVANSLFSNQLQETGALTFVDRAVAAGVDATDLDSFGVCFGDVDNDGDPDLLVLGNHEPNRFFENQGGGGFADRTAESGLGGGSRTSTSCSLGDVNNDGLLDVLVANAYDNWSHQLVVADTFGFNEHNQLFLNTGGNVFTDASAASGVETIVDLPPDATGSATLTWAISLVDYDQDGDVDIIAGDDQELPLLPAAFGGFDLGLLRVFQNDGLGNFSDVTGQVGTALAGVWMGMSYGDINCDGNLDIFATNGGDYVSVNLGFPLGAGASQWFLGQDDGTFTLPGVGDLVATPFGWGTSMLDYDNDGDADIVFHGGFDTVFSVDASNAGALLRNENCAADFARDAEALDAASEHGRRAVYGVAAGDLDNDGFEDIVSVSAFDIPSDVPLLDFPFSLGSPFDVDAKRFFTFDTGENPGEFVWAGVEYEPGSLSVEINSGDNGNRWVAVDTLGTVGLTSGGSVNRDGVGAVVRFFPRPGRPSTTPVVAGHSYGSQDSLTANFGMGSARRGIVEVLWPGGVRNRLYNVRAGERITFPEIPCSFDGDAGLLTYLGCVMTSLEDLGDAGVLDRRERARFLASAIRAYQGRSHF